MSGFRGALSVIGMIIFGAIWLSAIAGDAIDNSATQDAVFNGQHHQMIQVIHSTKTELPSSGIGKSATVHDPLQSLGFKGSAQDTDQALKQAHTLCGDRLGPRVIQSIAPLVLDDEDD